MDEFGTGILARANVDDKYGDRVYIIGQFSQYRAFG